VYEYKARLVEVIDGDTLKARVDLGFHVSVEVTLRLKRIDAPELRGPDKQRGLLAKSALNAFCLGEMTIRTEKAPGDKYGRWLAEVSVNGQSINDMMVHDGHARYWDGTGAR
jgi:micrococcal nuclease